MKSTCKKCTKCFDEKPLDSFGRRKDSADGLNSHCRACRAKCVKEYAARNAEVIKARWKQFYAENKESLKQYAVERYHSNLKSNRDRGRDYYQNNKEASRASHRAWVAKNYHVVVAHNADRRASIVGRTPAWANTFFIAEAYALSKRRSEITGFKWHVDHIVPLTSKLVCGLHVEHNLRVIPAKENLSKNNRYWPDMPTENVGAI